MFIRRKTPRLPCVFLAFALRLPWEYEFTGVQQTYVKLSSQLQERCRISSQSDFQSKYVLQTFSDQLFSQIARLKWNTIQQTQRNAAGTKTQCCKRKKQTKVTEVTCPETCWVFADQGYQTRQYSPAIGCHLHQHLPPEHRMDEQLGTA